MAAVKRRRRSTGRDETGQRIAVRPEWSALAVFAALITLAPLAFGAVDQLVQAALLLLFAAGLALRPPVLVRPAPRTARLLLALAAILVLKEFAPAALFGATSWRTQMTKELSVDLPWMHHPEPGRAVDALLSGGMAVLWLLWVRTLAGRRENRAWLAWALAGAAATVAAVSFLVQTRDATAIYGLRYTPGWLGFGPFPNRNHTADFLAMGVVMACGVTVWSIVRRSTVQALVGTVFALVSLAGMLATQSRGGVIALSAGLAIYGGFCLAKFRDRRVLAAVVAIALLGLTVALTGGSSLFARFKAPSSAESNAARVAIWGETLKMWSDAPLLGHGAASFTSVFPLYAQLPLDNEVILHPESSWLQWLAELGLVPVALAVFLAGGWVLGRARGALASHRSFFLYAAGFATCGALLCHGFIDVPAHRWATAAYALAALGLACPRPKAKPRDEEPPVPPLPVVLAKRTALVPLAVAIFWLLPLVANWPASSPLTLQRQLALAGAPHGSAEGLPRLLPCFALNSQLHHLVGLAQLQSGAPEAQWQAQFEIADLLSPGFWGLPILQARACVREAPDLAFHFWQLAIERGGRRAEEIFTLGYDETVRLPLAREKWAAFVTTHPAFALEFVSKVPHETGVPIFAQWWSERGGNPETVLSDREAQTYYALAPAYSTADDFARFMQLRSALVRRDFFPTARVLHAFGDDARAWQLLSTRLREPELPANRPGAVRGELERRLRLSPDSYAGAQALAALCISEGDPAGAESILLEFAQRPGALPFFTRKAAYILKAKGRMKEAVEMMLREPGASG